LNSKQIYIAGPLFSVCERQFLEELVDKISKELKLDSIKDFFLPHRDAGDVGIAGRGRSEVFFDDLKALDDAKIVIAWLDGPDVDSGTSVELGYAYSAKDKKIFGLLTDRRRWDNSLEGLAINNMVWGVCRERGNVYRSIGSLITDLKNVVIGSQK
jgi:nucleoside 2-deoxyribosyltransferase